MKYGIIVYKRKGVINIGDDMQLLAIKEMYERLGISYESLIKIDFYDLIKYDGEEVLVPICFPFFGYNVEGNVTNFSPKIIPIFLSLSLYYPVLNNADVKYLSKYGPIGCRDQHTCDGLRKQNIDAYLNGCMTLTLNKRVRRKGNKIYCVDVYDELIPYIKEKYCEEIVFRSHIFSGYNGDTLCLADDLLNEYVENARIIITSRLHCALPCIALGLPVIFVNNCYDNRFTWLEDIIHVYTPEEWNQIEWEPQVVDIKPYKEILQAIGSNRLLGRECKTSIGLIEKMYKIRIKHSYTLEGLPYIERWFYSHWGDNDEYREFVVWGVSQFTTMLVDYIKKHYKKAILTDVVDSYKRMSYLGHITKKIRDVDNIENKYLFVCALAAAKSAKEFVKMKGLDSGRICILSTKGIH